MIIRKHKRYEKNAKGIPALVRKREKIIIELMTASKNLKTLMQVDMKAKNPESVINKPHLFSIRVDKWYRLFFTISDEDYENELDGKEKIINLYLIEVNNHEYKRTNAPVFNNADYE